MWLLALLGVAVVVGSAASEKWAFLPLMTKREESKPAAAVLPAVAAAAFASYVAHEEEQAEYRKMTRKIVVHYPRQLLPLTLTWRKQKR